MKFTRVIHGLAVESEQQLSWGNDTGEADRVVRLHPLEQAAVEDARLSEEIAGVFPPFPPYSVGLQEGKLIVRFLSSLEFTYDGHSLSTVSAPAVPLALADILLPNAVMAAILGSERQVVLHASAVTVDTGPVLALCGRSGSGKSTLAAVLSRQGAAVVSDDALRCEAFEGAVRCFRGSTELRLRSSAECLASGQSGETRRLPDRRLGWTSAVGGSVSRLGAIWIPTLCSARTKPSGVRLAGQSALASMLSALRIVWHSHWAVHLMPTLRRIAQTIPIYRVEVPGAVLSDESIQRWVYEFANRCVNR